MKKVLRSESMRDYVLFVTGINSGLRVSDLLGLKVMDVMDDKGRVRDRITLRRRRQGRQKDFPVSSTSSKALSEYHGDLQLDRRWPSIPLQEGTGVYNRDTGLQDIERGGEGGRDKGQDRHPYA